MISQVRLQQRYIAIKELNEEEALSIVLLCRVAGISRAAYYKWLNRTIPVRQEENEKLLEDTSVYSMTRRTAHTGTVGSR